MNINIFLASIYSRAVSILFCYCLNVLYSTVDGILDTYGVDLKVWGEPLNKRKHLMKVFNVVPRVEKNDARYSG